MQIWSWYRYAATDMKTFQCTRLRLCNYLMDRGFFPYRAEPDNSNQHYQVYLFEDTPALTLRTTILPGSNNPDHRIPIGTTTGTRTRMPFGNRFWICLVYQFQHCGIEKARLKPGLNWIFTSQRNWDLWPLQWRQSVLGNSHPSDGHTNFWGHTSCTQKCYTRSAWLNLRTNLTIRIVREGRQHRTKAK